MDQDQQIVDQCHRGQSAGFASLLLRYQERVYRRAYSFVHNREDALDITQEVFIKTIDGIQSFTPGRPLWPWLRRITTNVSLNFLRGRPALLSLDDPESPQVFAGGEDPAETALVSWRLEEVQQAMGRLPPLHRIAVVLRHQEGLGYVEIARAMDLPLGTVKTYLFRARAALRSELERREVLGSGEVS